jgi:hypothetical protein
MPTIPYDQKSRNFNTEDITDSEKSLQGIFSLPFIKYIGSDLGCSCGFRHSLLENDQWLNVVEEEGTEFDNSNHQNLIDFISNNNENEKKVEILACWEGDQNEPIRYHDIVKLMDVLGKDFYFKERGFYTVEL